MKYQIFCHYELIMETNLRKEAASAWKYQQDDQTASVLYIDGKEIGGTKTAKVPPAPPGKFKATETGVERATPGGVAVDFDRAERYYWENLPYAVRTNKLN